MHRSGAPTVVYLGEDRQLYLSRPAKYLFEFPARIIDHGNKTIIYITAVPHNFDGKAVIAPPGYVVQGIERSSHDTGETGINNK